MKRVQQAGFAILEFVLIVAFLAAVAGLGIVVMKRHANKAYQANTATTQVTSSKVPTAPAVTKTSDLTQAEQTVDSTNTDASTSDVNQLDAQVNDL